MERTLGKEELPPSQHLTPKPPHERFLPMGCQQAGQLAFTVVSLATNLDTSSGSQNRRDQHGSGSSALCRGGLRCTHVPPSRSSHPPEEHGVRQDSGGRGGSCLGTGSRTQPVSLQKGILLLRLLRGRTGEVSRCDTGSREGAVCTSHSYLENGSFSQQPLRQVLAWQLSRGLQLLIPVSGLKETKPCGKQCTG